MQIKLRTEETVSVKADIVTFTLGVQLYDKDVVKATQKMYETYAEIIKVCKDNKFMRITQSKVSTYKHRIEEKKEVTEGTVVKTQTDYVYKGFDAYGTVTCEIYLKHITADNLKAIYGLMAKSNKNLVITVDYVFSYSDNFMSNTQHKLRQTLVESAKKRVKAIYKDFDHLELESITYGYPENMDVTQYRASKMCMSETSYGSAVESVSVTADLALLLLTVENAPTKSFYDFIDTTWIAL